MGGRCRAAPGTQRQMPRCRSHPGRARSTARIRSPRHDGPAHGGRSRPSRDWRRLGTGTRTGTRRPLSSGQSRSARSAERCLGTPGAARRSGRRPSPQAGPAAACWTSRVERLGESPQSEGWWRWWSWLLLESLDPRPITRATTLRTSMLPVVKRTTLSRAAPPRCRGSRPGSSPVAPSAEPAMAPRHRDVVSRSEQPHREAVLVR